MLILSTLAALAALCHGSGLAVSEPKMFSLVQGGKPAATIVLPPNADSADARAAAILSKTVAAMTGAALPTETKPEPGRGGEIDIGFPDRALPSRLRRPRLSNDGFAVGTANGNLYVRTGGGKGSICGVVDLLETRFGCRYFSPEVQLFPKQSDLEVRPFLVSENPVNHIRIVNGDFNSDPDYVDWQRLNTIDEIFGPGYYVHTSQKLVPPETYFKAHPEYFAFVDGRRTPDQLCPSRPENVDIVVAQLKKEMAAHPDKRVWSVSQNDNDTYCHCPDCMRIIKEEGSPAGPLLRFVNEVARHFPDKTISTLAYQFSRSAPKVTKPERNVQIMLCTIELNRSQPIATDPTSASFRKDIEDWSKIAPEIYLWDYTVDFAHQITPFPNLPVLQPNIRFFTKYGVREQFQQTNTSYGHEFSELKSYLEAHLLWNPNADVQSLLTDFLNGYYGAAGPAIGEYIAAIEAESQRSGKRLDIFERPGVHRDDFLSADNMAHYNALFDRAEAAVADQPDQLERVKTARLPIQYAALSIASEDMFGPRGFFVDRSGRPEVRPEMQRTLDEFLETCERNHVRSVNESNLTPKQFHDSIARMLKLQMDGNLAFRKAVSADPAPSPKYGRGDLSLLTNGVLGSSDFNVQWLGWEGTDFTLNLDLGSSQMCREANIDTISSWRSWILHPDRVTCWVSEDGANYREVGSDTLIGDHRDEPPIESFQFMWRAEPVRYVRMKVEGTKQLPTWHPSPGGRSWVFVDEFVVR